MRRRRTGAAVAAGVLMLGLALQLAGPAGFGRLPVVAALVAPRNGVTAALAVLGLAAIGLAARRTLRPVLLPIGVALLLAAAAGLPAVIARGATAEDPAPADAATIRILSWNINGDLVPPTAVARLAAAEQADLVVLPEIAPAENGPEYRRALALAGLHMTPVPPIGSGRAETVVLVGDRLGPYRFAGTWPEAPDSSAILRPKIAQNPVIVALHAAQPALRSNGVWQTELARAAAACRDPRTVVVGDFNGTLDDFGGSGLGACRDAAAVRSAASLGSWPTAVSPLLAMPIDHVLVGASWSVRSFSVLTTEDGSGARHRPILAVIAAREAR